MDFDLNVEQNFDELQLLQLNIGDNTMQEILDAIAASTEELKLKKTKETKYSKKPEKE